LHEKNIGSTSQSNFDSDERIVCSISHRLKNALKHTEDQANICDDLSNQWDRWGIFSPRMT